MEVVPDRLSAQKLRELKQRLGRYFQQGQWSKGFDALDILYAQDRNAANGMFSVPLEDFEADIKTQSFDMTPLMLAAYCGNQAVCKILCEQYNADCDLRLPLIPSEVMPSEDKYQYLWEVDLGKNRFYLISPIESKRFEVAYGKYVTGERPSPTISYLRRDPGRSSDEEGRKYEIDFQRMVQTRLKTGAERKLRRTCIQENPWGYRTKEGFVLWDEHAPEGAEKLDVKLWSAKDIPSTRDISTYFQARSESSPPEFPELTAANLPYPLSDYQYIKPVDKPGVTKASVFEDPNGLSWLFKPAATDFLAGIEGACSKLQRRIGLLAPLVFTLTAEEASGLEEIECLQAGSFQRMLGTNLESLLKKGTVPCRLMDASKAYGAITKAPCELVKKSSPGNWVIRAEDGSEKEEPIESILFPDLNLVEGAFRKGFDPSKLEAGHTLWLQKHLVFDWLIGNFDPHKDQYIRLRGEFDMFLNIFAIDKGQAFKHCWTRTFTSDGFHPFSSDGLTEPFPQNINIYRVMDFHLRKGMKPDGWADLRDKDYEGHDHKARGAKLARELDVFLKTVASIEDDFLKDIFHDYANNASHIGPTKSEEFFKKLIEHKNGIRDKFHLYHQSLPPFL